LEDHRDENVQALCEPCHRAKHGQRSSQDIERQRLGRPVGIETEKVTILLPADLRDWAKAQPGGLSLLVRTLLEQKRGAK
jgi:hypothetical protein